VSEVALQPYQERVVEEKKELDEKIAKLTTFLDGEIFAAMSDQKEQIRLIRQRAVMGEYSRLLGDRIAAFSEASSKS
jgi:hypothetical protein